MGRCEESPSIAGVEGDQVSVLVFMLSILLNFSE